MLWLAGGCVPGASPHKASSAPWALPQDPTGRLGAQRPMVALLTNLVWYRAMVF